MQLILLSAGRGSRLSKKLRSRPKSMTLINGKPIIEHNINFFNKYKKKIIITGYRKKLLNNFSKKNNFKQIYNHKFQTTNMVHSMFLASKFINQDVIICYGDIIFDPKVSLSLKENGNILPLNSEWLKIWKKRMPLNKIKKDAEDVVIKKNYLKLIGGKIKKKYPKYQYMGIFKLSKKTYFQMLSFYKTLNYQKIDMTSFLNLSLEKKILRMKIKKFKGYWYEIDTTLDANVASKEILKNNIQ